MDCSPPGSSAHGVFRLEYQGKLSFPSPGDPSYPGIEPGSSALQADSLLSEPPRRQCIYVNPNLPIHTPLGIHMLILYIYVSISALQIRPSISSF